MTAAGGRGTTTVSDRAVRRIAERAVTEALPGQGAGATRSTVTVRGRRAEVGLDVTLPFSAPLAEAVRGVQDHVAARTGRLTGLDIAPPRLRVTGLAVTGLTATGITDADTGAADTAATGAADRVAEAVRADTAAAGAAGLQDPPVPSAKSARPHGDSLAPGGRTPRRWWSRRRLPMALLTLAATVACGALAADLILVHAVHRPVAAWRTGAPEALDRLGSGSAAGLAAGVGLALLGLLLVVLAVTPGRRRLLTVTAPAPRLGAAVDRRAVAALLRDAVGAGAGIDTVRARVGRRRVTVTALLAFGDMAAARDEAEATACRTLDDCGLRRRPRLRVRIRPHPAHDPAAARDTGAHDTVAAGDTVAARDLGSAHDPGATVPARPTGAVRPALEGVTD